MFSSRAAGQVSQSMTTPRVWSVGAGRGQGGPGRAPLARANIATDLGGVGRAEAELTRTEAGWGGVDPH